jgi:hypothetical protein
MGRLPIEHEQRSLDMHPRVERKGGEQGKERREGFQVNYKVLPRLSIHHHHHHHARWLLELFERPDDRIPPHPSLYS